MASVVTPRGALSQCQTVAGPSSGQGYCSSRGFHGVSSARAVRSRSRVGQSVPTKPWIVAKCAENVLCNRENGSRSRQCSADSGSPFERTKEFYKASLANGSLSWHRRSDRHFLSAASSSADNPAGPSDIKPREWPLPRSAEESVDQARAACRRAIAAGERRLRVDLLLPLIGATDLDDWPGGIQQQFKAAAPLVASLLNALIDGPDAAKPDGGCAKSVIDQGDAVVAWESDKVALLLFATAETLPQLEALAGASDRPLLLVNPQWQSGQVVSDFGFGARKRAAEALVSSFADAYAVKRTRIRSKDVRLLKCYPDSWQVFLADANGAAQCIAVEEEMPSYKQLEALLSRQQGRNAPQGWFERLKSEFKFNQDSLKG